MQRRSWILACLALACSSGTLDEPAGDGGSGGSAGGKGGGTSAPECETPGYPTTAEQLAVGAVDATLLDLEGNPVTDILTQLCGLDSCLNGDIDASGYATVAGTDPMMLPAFKYGGLGLDVGAVARHFPKIALLLEAPFQQIELGQLDVVVLPAEGSPIAAGATVASGGIELTVPADASVTFDRLTYRTDDEQAFRAAELAPELTPTGFASGLDFAFFYALSPIETEFCPPAALTVPNGAELESGAEVEFFVHGTDVLARHAPYGGFTKVAEGIVSDDGSVISTTSGGLPVLSLVAVKLKQ